MKKNIQLLSLIISLYLLFLLITLLVVQKNSLIPQIDYSAWQLLHSSNPIYLKFFQSITNLGQPLTVVLLAILGSFLVNKQQRIFLLTTIIINTVGNHYFKYLIGRPRPQFPHLVNVQGYSFPSGHAVAITTLVLVLQIIIWQNTKKRLGLYLLALIVLLIMGSRIILQVHFFSDVLAGCCIAIANTLLIKYLLFDSHLTIFDSSNQKS